MKRFAICRLHSPDKEAAMDQSHYSKVFGLSLAAALGLMLALSALAQSAPRGSTILANPSLAR